MWHHGAACVSLWSTYYNWAEFMFDHMKEKILALKEDWSREHFGGCSHFLMMVMEKVEAEVASVHEEGTRRIVGRGNKRGGRKRAAIGGEKTQKKRSMGPDKDPIVGK